MSDTQKQDDVLHQYKDNNIVPSYTTRTWGKTLDESNLRGNQDKSPAYTGPVIQPPKNNYVGC